MRSRLLAACALASFGLLSVPGLVSSASAAPAFTEPEDCLGSTSGKKKAKGDTYFLFEYNDSNVVGVDSGCATKNDITRADVPGLIANTLHVSCSDKFIGGVGQKSDLGVTADGTPRRTVAWLIIKDGGKKTCGVGTPIPADGSIAGWLVAGGAGAAGLAAVALQRRRRTNTAELTRV